MGRTAKEAAIAFAVLEENSAMLLDAILSLSTGCRMAENLFFPPRYPPKDKLAKPTSHSKCTRKITENAVFVVHSLSTHWDISYVYLA